MKIIWATLRWLLSNALLFGCLYMGIFKEIIGAQNLAMAIVWFTFIMSAFLWKNEVAIAVLQKGTKRVNHRLDMFVDFLAIGIMVWGGWIFMPILYFISIFGMGQLHNEKLIKQAACNGA